MYYKGSYTSGAASIYSGITRESTMDKPTKRDQAVMYLDEIENGMTQVAMTQDIWQNKLIYVICCAVRFLLEQYIKGEKR